MKRKITLALFISVIITGTFVGCGNKSPEGRIDSVMTKITDVMEQAEAKQAELERIAAEKAAKEAEAKEEAEKKEAEEEAARIEAEKKAEEEAAMKAMEAELIAGLVSEGYEVETQEETDMDEMFEVNGFMVNAAMYAGLEPFPEGFEESLAANNSNQSQQSAPSTPAVSLNASDLLAMVNEDRANNGVGELTWSDSLAQYCNDRIPVIVDNQKSGRWIHEGWTIMENITRGAVRSASAANTEWINSPEHHAERIQAGYTFYAAACYQDPETGWVYWIEAFE